MLPAVYSRSRRYLWLQWGDFLISHATSISCAKHRALFTLFCQSLKAVANHQNRFFISLAGPLKECYINKHLWLCCRKELMLRLSGGGGGGETSQGALGESCSTWALRVTSAEGRIPLGEWCGEGNRPHRVLWGWWGPCKDSSRLCWDSSRRPSVLNCAEER